MAVTKKDFTDLLGESISTDLAAEAAPSSQKEHAFSETFEKRMSDFFSGKDAQRRKAKVNTKRWLIVAIAAVLLLAAVACAIPEVRQSIAGFFVRIFGNHVEYTAPVITKDRIEEEYGLVPLPEGFVQISKENTDRYVVTLYLDADDNVIILRQSVTEANIDSIDNEHGEFQELRIGENTIRVHYSEVGANAAWLENGYYFSLGYGDYIDHETFEEWVSSVKVIQP